MASRKRHAPGGAGTPVAPTQAAPASDGATTAPSRPADPALAAFAAFVRGEEEKEREAKRSAKRERAEADAYGKLLAAKDAAAATVKRLRDRGVPAQKRAAADLDYREALAAVVAAETGAAPTWAPAPTEGEDEGAVIEATEAAAEDETDATDPADDAPADEE